MYSGRVYYLINTTKVSSTLQISHKVKRKLENQILKITNQPEIYAQSPFDFSRNRKLSFETTLKIILPLEGKVYLVNYSHILILP